MFKNLGFLSLLFFVECFHAKSLNITNYRVTPLSDCRARLDDGSIIDLSSLNNPKNPVSCDGGYFQYQYNPCVGIVNCGNEKTAAICQKQKDAENYFNLGDEDTYEFTYDGTNLNIKYNHNDGKQKRISNVKCVCGTGESSNLQFTSEMPTLNYNLVLTSKCCCPGICKSVPIPNSGKKNLSIGSILTIIFFSVLATYVIGGMLIMRFARNARGVEMIPNYTTWVSVKDNMKGGIEFSVGRLKSMQGGYSKL